MASDQTTVGDEEIYGRFVMDPRHQKNPFISLRRNEEGVSGMIISRFKDSETIEPCRQTIMRKSKQFIPSMLTSLVKHIRNISIKDVIDVDVILTEINYPYHAEIRFINLKDNELVNGNTRLAEFSCICDDIKDLLSKNRVTCICLRMTHQQLI